MHIHVISNMLALSNSVASDLATLSGAIVLGLMIGAIRIRSVRLGISAVLFSSLVFGQFGFTIDERLLDFLRDFALILFMYALGLQVGPGFGASLRSTGIRLNALSVGVIVIGAAMSVAARPFLPKGTGAGLSLLGSGRLDDRSGFTYFDTADKGAGVTLEVRQASTHANKGIKS